MKKCHSTKQLLALEKHSQQVYPNNDFLSNRSMRHNKR